MSNVKLKNLVKTYDNKSNVIDNIDLDINDKEFIVLVGSSGCGKSTILRLISGLEDITSGEIFIDNQLVNNIHPKNRDIAFVFQNYALYPHMNVYENMAFGLKMRKYKKDEIKQKVLEAAKILDLENLLDRKPKELSGGQRQRVALGRAIVRNPKVFLMDEPLSNLDANLRVHMRSEIKKLHKKLQTTFIYVTHDQTEALTMGDRIVILDKGKVQQVDTPENIYKNPCNKFVAGFIGQMNFIDVNINNSEFIINDTKLKLTNDNVNYDLISIGIRAENMINGDIEIKAKVDIVELLGAEKNVYFELNGAKCSAKVPLNYDCDGEIILKLNLDDIYYFDSVSQKRVYFEV